MLEARTKVSSVNFVTCTLANLDAVCNWANGVFSQQYQDATTCDQNALAGNPCADAGGQ